MVGGEPRAFATIESLLRGLGQTITHIGPSGQAWCSSSRSDDAWFGVAGGR
jgi:hypothetical protein